MNTLLIKVIYVRILELELHKYIRLAFSAIETIIYRPELDSQIIIGSNGSGKSSLMMELNPLPVAKNYMLPGGYKRVEIEHKGIRYTLLSTYGKGAKNSFIEHTESGAKIEHNEGGTGMAQKILIEKIFGLNIELLRLWVGQTSFTELAPTKRRDWILKLSGNDLDYAMKAFNVAKNMFNDAKAVDKHITHRLGEETSDIADQDRIDHLEDQVATLTNELNGLLEQKDNSIPSVPAIALEMSRLSREFEECVAEASTLRLVKPSFITREINNIHSLKEVISNFKTELTLQRTRLDELYAQKTHIEETLKALSKNGVNSANELQSVTDEINKEIEVIVRGTDIFNEIDIENIEMLVGRFAGQKGMIVEMLSTLPFNDGGYYSREKLEKTKAFITKYQGYLGSANNRIADLKHYVKHYKNTDSINCPKCEHSFIPGFNKFDPAAAEKEITELNGHIHEAELKLNKALTYAEECTDYVRQISTFKRMVSENPDFEPLWVRMVKENLYKVHPHLHLPLVENFSLQLENCLSIAKLKESVKLNETILKTIGEQNSESKTYSGDHVIYLDGYIAKNIARIKELEHQVQVSMRYYHNVDKTTKAIDRAQEIRDNLAGKYDLIVKATINQAVNQQIQSRQVNLANANGLLTKINKHDAVIKDLEIQKRESTEKVMDTNTVMRALSPVDGLISNYIQSFLNVFIGDINDVVSDIWTTDLEILTCGVDTTDVTCKFPLSVNNGFLVTPDISESSDGQKDVINFAFRIVIAQYLGLHDYPLFLDELAPTLDEKHRENITRFINDLMEGNQFEQMFMISHYSANHYAFANSEILMLDGRNIINKPVNYNRHVKITYSDELKQMVDEYKKAA